MQVAHTAHQTTCDLYPTDGTHPISHYCSATIVCHSYTELFKFSQFSIVFCAWKSSSSVSSPKKSSLILTDLTNFFFTLKIYCGYFSYTPLVLHCATTNGVVTVLILLYSHSSIPILCSPSHRQPCIWMCSDKNVSLLVLYWCIFNLQKWYCVL